MGLRTWIYQHTGINLKHSKKPADNHHHNQSETLTSNSLPKIIDEAIVNTSALNIFGIEPFIKKQGYATFYLSDLPITLDLSQKHERLYAAKLLLNIHYPQSDIDTMLFQKIIKPSDRVLDAGANIGFTALEILEQNANYILSIEAIPEIYSRLKRLECEKISTIHSALGAQEGEVEMIISQSHNQGSSYDPKCLNLFPNVFGENPNTVRVPLTTIDTLSLQYGHFDIWKIDVEGAEIDVLCGAKMHLQTNPPRAIIVEIYDDYFEEFQKLINATHPYHYKACIHSHDYTLHFIKNSEYNSQDYHGTSPTYVFTRSPIEQIVNP